MLTPITPRSKYLKSHQRKMRRNPTPAEEHMKGLLHEFKVRFCNQQCFYDMITKKCYITDFWLRTYRVVIECDGWQHYTEEGMKKDGIRDEHFAEAGIRILRFKNKSVFGLTKKKLLVVLGAK